MKVITMPIIAVAATNSRKFSFIFNPIILSLRMMEYAEKINNSVNKVEKAAPFGPYCGIKKAFKMTSITAEIKIMIRFESSFPNEIISPVPKNPETAHKKIYGLIIWETVIASTKVCPQNKRTRGFMSKKIPHDNGKEIQNSVFKVFSESFFMLSSSFLET